jgi:hypothetical protein
MDPHFRPDFLGAGLPGLREGRSSRTFLARKDLLTNSTVGMLTEIPECGRCNTIASSKSREGFPPHSCPINLV